MTAAPHEMIKPVKAERTNIFFIDLFMKAFFKDIKVVELASVLAGPAVGMFFAELGAQVIKVENKLAGGDVTRNWRLKNETKEGVSAYYSSINFGKKVMMANLNDAEDRDAVLQEIKSADIVISNYSEGVAAKLKMGAKDLMHTNKKLIFLQLDGFATNNRPAYDVVLQAETGWISMMGTEANPAKMPVALIDILAGHQLKEAALLALLKRERTGDGSYIQCDLERTSIASLANQATNFLMNGAIAQPLGTLHPNIAPYGDWFVSADDIKFVLAVGSDKHFEKLMDKMNLGSKSTAKYSTNVERLKNRKSLRALLQSQFLRHSFDELQQIMGNSGIPFGKIKKLDEVLSSKTANSMKLDSNMEGRKATLISSIAFSTDFLDS